MGRWNPDAIERQLAHQGGKRRAACRLSRRAESRWDGRRSLGLRFLDDAATAVPQTAAPAVGRRGFRKPAQEETPLAAGRISYIPNTVMRCLATHLSG